MIANRFFLLILVVDQSIVHGRVGWNKECGRWYKVGAPGRFVASQFPTTATRGWLFWFTLLFPAAAANRVDGGLNPDESYELEDLSCHVPTLLRRLLLVGFGGGGSNSGMQ